MFALCGGEAFQASKACCAVCVPAAMFSPAVAARSLAS